MNEMRVCVCSCIFEEIDGLGRERLLDVEMQKNYVGRDCEKNGICVSCSFSLEESIQCNGNRLMK